MPSVISASVANGQLAACWVALTPDGRYAFTIDAHNAAISSYAIATNGSLTLVNGTAVLQATSSIPLLDASVSGDGRFLYVVDVGREHHRRVPHRSRGQPERDRQHLGPAGWCRRPRRLVTAEPSRPGEREQVPPLSAQLQSLASVTLSSRMPA